MKILHVITSLRTGGAEKLMVDLLPRLRDLGNEVELLVFDGVQTAFYEELQEKQIKIHSLGNYTSVYHPFLLIKLLPYLKKFDVIHTHNTACQLFAAIAHFITRRGILVTTEHNTSNRRRDNKVFYLLDKFLYSQYKKVICISSETERNLNSYMPSTRGKSAVIFNGIDVQKIQSASLGQMNDKLIGTCKVLMIAAFRYQKDQQTLIKAFSNLPDDFHLYLAGEGPLKSTCENLSESLGLKERVHFLGVRSDIPQLIKASDIIVQSSHIDGFCLAAVEGMAGEKPVIATNIPGLSEVVKDAGILVDHEDVKQLAKVIKEIFNDKKVYQDVAKACLSRAWKFDISQMAKEYYYTYKELENV